MRSAIAALLALAVSSRADYAPMETRMVPIDRLVRNLEKEAAENPENPRPYFALGRLHAMAFALKVEEAPVSRRTGPGTRPGEETEVFYGYEKPRIPFTIKPVSDPAKAKAADAHLKQSIEAFEKALSRNPKFPAASLGLGWVLSKAGRADEARRRLREALAGAWEVEKGMERAFGFHWSIAMEAADYLLPLLDPKRDAKEMADIESKRAKLQRIPRAVTPLLMPLTDEGTLESLVSDKYVSFDLDGSGRNRPWRWITPKAAWIAFAGADEPIRSGIQLLGNVTFWLFWNDGFEALAALDDDRDGALRGSELDGLVAWRDLDEDGASNPQEIVSLASLGVTALLTSSRRHASGIPYHPHGVRLGSRSRPLYDWSSHTLPVPK